MSGLTGLAGLSFIRVSQHVEANHLIRPCGGRQAHDPTAIGQIVSLDRAAALPAMVYESAAGGIESIANRNVGILVRMVLAGIATDNDLRTGDGEIDVDREQPALLMPLVTTFDNDAAGGNPIEELVKLFRPLAYPRL